MSIIGNPVILGQSGGGASASIVLTVTHGATNVTCTTPNGIVLTVAGVIGTDTDVYTFNNLTVYGTYVCSATFSGVAKTKNVEIDSAEQYTASIIKELYIYDEGNECTSVTGGWKTIASGGWSDYPSTAYGITKNSNNMTINMSTAGYGLMGTNNKVDLRNYSKICTEISAYSTANEDAGYTEVDISAKSQSETLASKSMYSLGWNGTQSKTLGKTIFTANIIEKVDMLCDKFFILKTYRGKPVVTFYRIWIE